MSSSGTYTFNPPIYEVVLDAFERCQAMPPSLEAQHIRSAARSLNLVLSSWANRGINLWTVDQVTQFMPQGVKQYFDDATCIDVLPDSVVLRQYQMGAPSSVAPAFTTTASSATVTVANLPATPSAGGYIMVGVPVSVGGLILQGFYQVVSVPGSSQATITAASSATGSVSAGGSVPQFVSATNSTTITVNFNNHGLLAGQTFNVQVSTTVGGVTLLGPYLVNAGPTTNQFTITAPYPAGSVQTVSENGGLAQLATQATINGAEQPTVFNDIVLYAMSRGDYMAIPEKDQQGRPTSFWFDRQITPVFNIWLVPDQNGPYELRYRRSRRVQDADLEGAGSQTLNMPFRFFEAFSAEVASHLSMKWRPERFADLKAYADEQWMLASDEDRERVPTFLTPGLSGYFD